MEPIPDEVFYYTKDHLGSVRELVNYEGKIVQRYSYSTYGKTTIEDHDQSPFNKLVENRYAYTSREIEEETGDYYYRARYYDPAVGRFLSEDPIGFESGDFNLYRYVENNPISLTDPSGKNPVVGKLCMAIAAGVVIGLYLSEKEETENLRKDNSSINVGGGGSIGGGRSGGGGMMCPKETPELKDFCDSYPAKKVCRKMKECTP